MEKTEKMEPTVRLAMTWCKRMLVGEIEGKERSGWNTDLVLEAATYKYTLQKFEVDWMRERLNAWLEKNYDTRGSYALRNWTEKTESFNKRMDRRKSNLEKKFAEFEEYDVKEIEEE